MTNKDYLNDLSHIKELMNRSSRFLSLSGLSGILAGIYALVGAAFSYYYIFPRRSSILTLSQDNIVYVHSHYFKLLLLVLALVAGASIFTAYILSARQAKKNGEQMWTPVSKRLLINFLIPMVAGGIYILIKIKSQHYGLTASLMLLFYGLALVNASKYTLGTIRYLGYSQIVLGLICAAFPGYGFWFWVLGFGCLHILYGTLMYSKENKAA
ncbi:MAG: hypothetical protein OIF50_06815 [Flavobacteriaceae bacterium]|nr:hypothetical protein [Flavobacteriaceae bacterium]